MATTVLEVPGNSVDMTLELIYRNKYFVFSFIFYIRYVAFSIKNKSVAR